MVIWGYLGSLEWNRVLPFFGGEAIAGKNFRAFASQLSPKAWIAWTCAITPGRTHVGVSSRAGRVQPRTGHSELTSSASLNTP